jgi:hypothetical protein
MKFFGIWWIVLFGIKLLSIFYVNQAAQDEVKLIFSYNYIYGHRSVSAIYFFRETKHGQLFTPCNSTKNTQMWYVGNMIWIHYTLISNEVKGRSSTGPNTKGPNDSYG